MTFAKPWLVPRSTQASLPNQSEVEPQSRFPALFPSVTVFRVWHQPFTCFPALGAGSIFSALEAVQVFSNVWSKLRNYKRFQALLSSNIMSRKKPEDPLHLLWYKLSSLTSSLLARLSDAILVWGWLEKEKKERLHCINALLTKNYFYRLHNVKAKYKNLCEMSTKYSNYYLYEKNGVITQSDMYLWCPTERENYCLAKKVKYTTWGAKTTPKSCFFLDVISTKRSRV